MLIGLFKVIIKLKVDFLLQNFLVITVLKKLIFFKKCVPKYCLVCDHAYSVKCEESEKYFFLNKRIGFPHINLHGEFFYSYVYTCLHPIDVNSLKIKIGVVCHFFPPVSVRRL